MKLSQISILPLIFLSLSLFPTQAYQLQNDWHNGFLSCGFYLENDSISIIRPTYNEQNVELYASLNKDSNITVRSLPFHSYFVIYKPSVLFPDELVSIKKNEIIRNEYQRVIFNGTSDTVSLYSEDLKSVISTFSLNEATDGILYYSKGRNETLREYTFPSEGFYCFKSFNPANVDQVSEISYGKAYTAFSPNDRLRWMMMKYLQYRSVGLLIFLPCIIVALVSLTSFHKKRFIPRNYKLLRLLLRMSLHFLSHILWPMLIIAISIPLRYNDNDRSSFGRRVKDTITVIAFFMGIFISFILAFIQRCTFVKTWKCFQDVFNCPPATEGIRELFEGFISLRFLIFSTGTIVGVVFTEPQFLTPKCFEGTSEIGWFIFSMLTSCWFWLLILGVLIHFYAKLRLLHRKQGIRNLGMLRSLVLWSLISIVLFLIVKFAVTFLPIRTVSMDYFYRSNRTWVWCNFDVLCLTLFLGTFMAVIVGENIWRSNRN